MKAPTLQINVCRMKQASRCNLIGQSTIVSVGNMLGTPFIVKEVGKGSPVI